MPGMNKTYTTTVLGSIEMENQTHLILKDHSGFESTMPASLVKANDLKMENDDQLILTTGLYDMWFIKEKQTKLNENASILFRNFHTLYINKELILNDIGYKNLGLRWLYAGGLYYGTLRYSLGSLFAAWDTTPSLKKENGFMYKIGGSMLSGANVYETLNVENGKLGKGSIIRATGEHWTNYLLIYKKLSEEPINTLAKNLKYSNELIQTLKLS
jgi:hypothetical protein